MDTDTSPNKEGRVYCPFVPDMAEPRSAPGPGDAVPPAPALGAGPPTPSNPASPPPEVSPESVTDLFLTQNGEPADDAPTIISKSLPARAEEGAAAGLRGRRLAHFELIEAVGVGGMAAVIRARDLQLDRSVALKILPPEMAGDPENVKRFHQEARAAARLDHENIARVFFCGEDQKL